MAYERPVNHKTPPHSRNNSYGQFDRGILREINPEGACTTCIECLRHLVSVSFV